jgi:hypothetical protein
MALPAESAFWIGLTPVGAYGEFGLEYHLISDSLVGDEAAWRDGGGYGGFGWLGISMVIGVPRDTAFKIKGTIIPEPTGLLLVGAAAALCLRRRPGRGRVSARARRHSRRGSVVAVRIASRSFRAQRGTWPRMSKMLRCAQHETPEVGSEPARLSVERNAAPSRSRFGLNAAP